MDPLSIIASAIALAGAASTSLHKAREFFGAKTELLCLINEVSNIRLVVEEFDHLMRQRGSNAELAKESIDAIATVLQIAQADSVTLNEVNYNEVSRVDQSTGQQKVRRFAWTRHKSKLVRLQTRLKDTRTTLVMLCSSTTLSDVFRIHLQLTEVNILQTRHDSQLDEQSRLLKMILHQNLGPKSWEASDQSVDVGSSSPPSSTSSSTTTPTGILTPEEDPASGAETDQESSTRAGSALIQIDGGIQISATRYRMNRCESWCSCRCHKPQALRTPSIARLLIGSLFIGYTGIPSISQSCTEKTCRRQANPSLRINYQFPAWLLDRMFRFAILGTTLDGPRISISMPRLVPDNSEIFVCAVQGNVNGLKMLFERGVASPFDVGMGTGRTALHYAVNYNHPKLAQMLLHAGANAQAEDHEHATTIALAWRRVFGNLAEESTISALRVMFEDEEFLDSRVFQPLHKIILGMSGAKLEEQLLLTTSSIDDTDADGRTALSWAATRGDLGSVTTLLRFGADPNIPSCWAQSPLHFAAQNKRATLMPILQALIDNGAEVNAVDYWNRTALTYASGNHASTAPLQLLVECGTALNVRDRRLRTALGYAARLCNFQHAEYLLQSGADPHLPDEFNVLPLLEAVKNNQHMVLRLLLPVSSPRSIVPYDSSLLHWIAAYSDGTAINTILEHFSGDLFDGCEVYMSNREGFLPEELFQQRSYRPKELEANFETLMQKVFELNKVGEPDLEDVASHRHEKEE